MESRWPGDESGRTESGRAEDDGPGVQEHDEAGRVTNLGRANSRDPWAQSGAWNPFRSAPFRSAHLLPFGTPDSPPSALTILYY